MPYEISKAQFNHSENIKNSKNDKTVTFPRSKVSSSTRQVTHAFSDSAGANIQTLNSWTQPVKKEEISYFVLFANKN